MASTVKSEPIESQAAEKKAAEEPAADQPGSKKIKLESNNDANKETTADAAATNNTSTTSDLNARIVKQLSYYFSDVNVVRDKFLLNEFKKDNGWVSLGILMKFKRLHELAKEEDNLFAALKAIAPAGLQFDELKRAVRRKDPIPDIETYRAEADKRTIHVSGFPTAYTFENLTRFCSQYGEVESCQMRHHFRTKFFKGSILVTFKDEESASKLHTSKPVMCKDRELRVETMKEYHKRKSQMAEERARARKLKRSGKGKGGDGDSAGDKTKVKEEEEEDKEQDPKKDELAPQPDVRVKVELQ